MNNKFMLINVTDDESRIGIVEDAVLQEMLIEHQTREQIKNNIYKGVVVQVQTALQAAFVDFGNKKHGFLPASEINSNLYKNKKFKGHRPSIQKILQPGQSVIVQVTREAVDNKGAALSTNVSLPGRFMVLMPDTKKGGISKKIDDADERERLKGFISGIESEDHAVIIRTAGIGRDLLELKKDYTSLKKTWEEIQNKFQGMNRPGLIQEEDDVVVRTLRDYYTEDIKEIWVDNAEVFQKALMFLKANSPRRQKDLKLFVGDRSLFATYNIEKQVEQLTDREIPLKSGGSIVMEQTEALVSIDVNSGKSNQEDSIDDTALRTNLEAANEIARQLRLRNLAGLIVVDFIDMETEAGRKKVEQEIQNAMSRDKAQRKYNPISQFGLMEMSRQRLSVGISRTIESICPTCNGKGRVASIMSATNLIIRKIRELAAKGNIAKIEGELPLDIANHLLNERRKSVTDLELEFDIQIIIKSNPDLTTLTDKCLKPFFNSTQATPQEKVVPQKDKQKPESIKKKGKKHHSDKKNKKEYEQDAQKQSTEIVVEVVDVVEAVEPEIADVVEIESAPELHAPKKKNKPHHEKAKKVIEEPKIISNDDDLPLHPSCLFQDVKELSADDLEEVTSSFENRLKGKSDNQIYANIDPKFLWSSKSDPEKSKIKDEKSEQKTEADETPKAGKKQKSRKGNKKSNDSKKNTKTQSEKETKEELKKEEKKPEKSTEKNVTNQGSGKKSTKKTSTKKSSSKQKAGEEEKKETSKASGKKGTKKTSTKKSPSKQKTEEASKDSDKKSTKKTSTKKASTKKSTATKKEEGTSKKETSKTSEKKDTKSKKSASPKSSSGTKKAKSSSKKRTTTAKDSK